MPPHIIDLTSDGDGSSGPPFAPQPAPPSAAAAGESADQPSWCDGLPQELMHTVERELKHIALAALGHEARSHTLQPTAIINEVWLRLAGNDDLQFPTREAFFAFAAKAIRNILVDHARRKYAAKRGGRGNRRPFIEALEHGSLSEPGLLELEDELLLMEKLHPMSAQIIEMRLYGGMTDQQIALRLGITVRTVRRHARVARLFLRARHDEIQHVNDDDGAV